MTNFRYVVTDKNEVFVWNEDYPNPDGSPCLVQPRYPGGEEWIDRDDAIAWAESYIAHTNDIYGAPVPKAFRDQEPQYAIDPTIE